MPAPLAKGILITLSILAAVGIAVYENPQFKEWVDDQRRKITEFLRTFGDQLDPQSRREAEAFAYEGRLPLQSREEAAASAYAVARATGRETGDGSISRRNRTSVTPQSPDEVEERKRLGREYLAKRNQEMLDLKERQKMKRDTSDLSEKTPSSPTFDQLVNIDGSLEATDKETSGQTEEFNEKTLDLSSVPTDEPTSLRGIPTQAALAETAFATGSRYANPFGDAYELGPNALDSRSPTPKPPVPPKLALEDPSALRKLPVPQKQPSIRQIPVFEAEEEAVPLQDLSYEDQLVRALSLSLAESEDLARRARAAEQESQRDADFAAAVAASLADVEKLQQQKQKQKQKQTPEQLVALTPDPPISIPASDSDAEDLYTLSPALRSRPLAPSPPMTLPPYDPVHEAAAQSQKPSPSTATFPSPLIERDAISLSSASSAAFASAPASAVASIADSEISLIEFVASDEDDSDDEGAGILTPGSWTDVGSDVGSED